MRSNYEKYITPVVILVVVLLLWEFAVAALQIEEFLLPRPSAIISNLGRVIIFTPKAVPEDTSEIASQLKANTLFASIPQDTPPEALKPILSATILAQFSMAGNKIMLIQGQNFSPIVQAGWFTLKEALGGFAVGCTLGVLIALVTARWTATQEALMPFAIAVNSMPIIAFAPIMNNWFGIDNPFSKISIVAIMCFFPMMINTVRGLTLVDARSLELMRSYAAGGFAVVFKLRIPNSLPFVFSGLKVAAALSMIGAIVGEYFGGPRIALGVFITQEAALFRFSSAWAAIIIACIMGIALYVIIIVIERLVMPWHVSFR